MVKFSRVMSSLVELAPPNIYDAKYVKWLYAFVPLLVMPIKL